MTLETIIIWIIVGGVAGLLAAAVVRSHIGIVGAVIVGIIGAFIGGWIFSLFNLSVEPNIIGQIITAFVGAVVLLLIVRGLRRV